MFSPLLPFNPFPTLHFLLFIIHHHTRPLFRSQHRKTNTSFTQEGCTHGLIRSIGSSIFRELLSLSLCLSSSYYFHFSANFFLFRLLLCVENQKTREHETPKKQRHQSCPSFPIIGFVCSQLVDPRRQYDGDMLLMPSSTDLCRKSNLFIKIVFMWFYLRRPANAITDLLSILGSMHRVAS